MCFLPYLYHRSVGWRIRRKHALQAGRKNIHQTQPFVFQTWEQKATAGNIHQSPRRLRSNFAHGLTDSNKSQRLCTPASKDHCTVEAARTHITYIAHSLTHTHTKCTRGQACVIWVKLFKTVAATGTVNARVSHPRYVVRAQRSSPEGDAHDARLDCHKQVARLTELL